MSSEPENVVADLVAAAGGRLVSRIRLQKIAYLIDKLGADTGFSFSYYHYGPYSRDLDNAVLDAQAFDKIEEEFASRQSDGARYSIFKIKTHGADNNFEYLNSPELRQLVRELTTVNVTVLEVAATAHWLQQEEGVPDWKSELIRRKGTKASISRVQEAMDLLTRLGLPPAVSKNSAATSNSFGHRVN